MVKVNNIMDNRVITLLCTEGDWFGDICSMKKPFDARIGHRDVRIGDVVRFIEASAELNGCECLLTGRECLVRVTSVVHTEGAPEHFDWNDIVMTIFGFEMIGIYDREVTMRGKPQSLSLEGELSVVDHNEPYPCSSGPAWASYIGDIMIMNKHIGVSIFEEFIGKKIRLTIEVID